MKLSGQSDFVLIKNALIADPNSKHYNKRSDVFIEGGKIKSIGKKLKEPFGCTVISGKDLAISPGWFDLHVNIPDPGFEYREDISSALKAAAAGGFTGILSCSQTSPATDTKSGIEYQLKKSRNNLVDLYVAGALSKGNKGEEISEMYDMHCAGARAFYDFKSPVANTKLLKIALLYAKGFDGLIMLHPADSHLSDGAVMNEGIVSTVNGLVGFPSIAEEMAVERALKLVEYTGQKLHFTAISTSEGISLLKKAKKSGISVTAGVCAANLLFSENELSQYDSNFKLNPPLREYKVRKLLQKALREGDIDVVISDHWPQNIENKDCEFELADFGMSTLETAYPMMQTAFGESLTASEVAEIMAVRPRNILNIPVPQIEEGETANCTIFQPTEEWTFNLKNSHSLSANTSLDGYTFKGKVCAVVNGSQIHVNS